MPPPTVHLIESVIGFKRFPDIDHERHIGDLARALLQHQAPFDLAKLLVILPAKVHQTTQR